MQKRMHIGFLIFFLISSGAVSHFALENNAAAASVPKWWRASDGEYQQLVKNAEKEGTVVWHDSMRTDEVNKIIKAFNKEFPGIKVDHTRASTMEARERILRELMAGSKHIDVLEVTSELIPEFKKQGFLMAYDWSKNFQIDPIQPEKDNQMLKIGGSLHLITYNTEKVSPQDAPKTWEDLLDPKWKDHKIGVDTRPKGFTELYIAWGEKKAVEYCTKLAAQGLVMHRGTTALVKMLGAGEFHIAAGITFKAYLRNKKKGAPLEVVCPTTVGASFEREGALAVAPHPNAAVLFLGWLASGGQGIYDELSSGEGMPLPMFDTMQGRLVRKTKPNLIVQGDEWLPKRGHIEEVLQKAFLGI